MAVYVTFDKPRWNQMENGWCLLYWSRRGDCQVKRISLYKKLEHLFEVLNLKKTKKCSFSVRAGLFDQCGKLIKSSTQACKIWNPLPNYYEQSSENIWESCCKVVRVIFQLFHFVRYSEASPIILTFFPRMLWMVLNQRMSKGLALTPPVHW